MIYSFSEYKTKALLDNSGCSVGSLKEKAPPLSQLQFKAPDRGMELFFCIFVLCLVVCRVNRRVLSDHLLQHTYKCIGIYKLNWIHGEELTLVHIHEGNILGLLIC